MKTPFVIAMLVGLALVSGATAQVIDPFPPQGDNPSPVMVTVMNIHLCCDKCVKAIEQAARGGDVQSQVDKAERMITLTAPRYEDVERSLESIARLGLSGTIEDDTEAGRIAFPEIRTPDHNVKQLTVRHIYNCCPACSNAIITAIESVEGVQSHTVKPRQTSFVVEGDFDPGDVVEALCEAGFYPEVQSAN
jgi:copper chaperone CopZ